METRQLSISRVCCMIVFGVLFLPRRLPIPSEDIIVVFCSINFSSMVLLFISSVGYSGEVNWGGILRLFDLLVFMKFGCSGTG